MKFFQAKRGFVCVPECPGGGSCGIVFLFVLVMDVCFGGGVSCRHMTYDVYSYDYCISVYLLCMVNLEYSIFTYIEREGFH